MATTDHTHNLEALDGGVSGPHCLEATWGSGDTLDPAMVGFNDVVQVLRCSVLRVRR